MAAAPAAARRRRVSYTVAQWPPAGGEDAGAGGAAEGAAASNGPTGPLPERYTRSDIVVRLRRQVKALQAREEYLKAERVQAMLDQFTARDSEGEMRHLQHIQREDLEAFVLFAEAQRGGFHEFWSEQAAMQRARETELVVALQRRQERERAEAEDKHAGRRHFAKPSREVLELKARQRALGQAKQFRKADNMRAMVEHLEGRESAAHGREVQRGRRRVLEQLAVRHSRELRTLRTRLAAERALLVTRRDRDYDAFRQRVKNMEMDMRRTHKRQLLYASRRLEPKYSATAAAEQAATLMLGAPAPAEPAEGGDRAGPVPGEARAGDNSYVSIS